MEELEKLTKRLKASVDFALYNEEDLDAASWSYEEGILITVNEAKLLLEIVKNYSNLNLDGNVCGRCEKKAKHKESVYCLDCLYERKMSGY